MTEDVPTSAVRYLALVFSGKSGRTKNPAMAIGNVINPSTMKSLGLIRKGHRIQIERQSRFHTIASP